MEGYHDLLKSEFVVVEQFICFVDLRSRLGGFGCASLFMPSGTKILPKGADGLQRIEVSEAAPNEVNLYDLQKRDWNIEMGMPGGWKLSGRTRQEWQVSF